MDVQAVQAAEAMKKVDFFKPAGRGSIGGSDDFYGVLPNGKWN